MVEAKYDKKFFALIDQAEEAARGSEPDYVFLTFSVCAGEPISCGWKGWLLEAAFRKSGVRLNTSTGDETVPIIDNQICPSCKNMVFRSGLSKVYSNPAEPSTVA